MLTCERFNGLNYCLANTHLPVPWHCGWSTIPCSTAVGPDLRPWIGQRNVDRNYCASEVLRSWEVLSLFVCTFATGMINWGALCFQKNKRPAKLLPKLTFIPEPGNRISLPICRPPVWRKDSPCDLNTHKCATDAYFLMSWTHGLISYETMPVEKEEN